MLRANPWKAFCKLERTLWQEKSSKLGKKRQQKQAAAAKAGTEEDAAAEDYRESSPTLADSRSAEPSSPSQAAGAVSAESAPTDAAEAGSGQLLGGCEDSDSGASSATSLPEGFPGDPAPLPADPGSSWEPLTDTACTRVDAYASPPADLALPSNTQYPGAPAADSQHPSTLPGRGHPNAMDGITGASSPANNLHSDTCISRDADTLTMNAGEDTEFPERQAAAAAAVQAHQAHLTSGQPSSRARRVCPYITFVGRPSAMYSEADVTLSCKMPFCLYISLPLCHVGDLKRHSRVEAGLGGQAMWSYVQGIGRHLISPHM